MPARDGNGSFVVTLPRDVLDKLNYLRGPGESYGDVGIWGALWKSARSGRFLGANTCLRRHVPFDHGRAFGPRRRQPSSCLRPISRGDGFSHAANSPDT